MQAEQSVEQVVYEGSVAGLSLATTDKRILQIAPYLPASSISDTSSPLEILPVHICRC